MRCILSDRKSHLPPVCVLKHEHGDAGVQPAKPSWVSTHLRIVVFAVLLNGHIRAMNLDIVDIRHGRGVPPVKGGGAHLCVEGVGLSGLVHCQSRETHLAEKRAKPARYSHTVSGENDGTRTYMRMSNFLPPIRYGLDMYRCTT